MVVRCSHHPTATIPAPSHTDCFSLPHSVPFQSLTLPHSLSLALSLPPSLPVPPSLSLPLSLPLYTSCSPSLSPPLSPVHLPLRIWFVVRRNNLVAKYGGPGHWNGERGSLVYWRASVCCKWNSVYVQRISLFARYFAPPHSLDHMSEHSG